MATPREQLANLLRQARLDAGYESHAALAKRLSVSRPVVSKAENPSSPTPSDTVLAAWAGATGAGLDELTKLAQQARSGPPGWFAGWTDDIEACASVIRWFEPLLIPGLIQTKAYANAVLSWKPESASTEANLKNRLARQSLLDRSYLTQGMRMLAVTWTNDARGRSAFWLHAALRHGIWPSVDDQLGTTPRASSDSSGYISKAQNRVSAAQVPF
jgi:transcriptional regulator with XRE-family HTH domain